MSPVDFSEHKGLKIENIYLIVKFFDKHDKKNKHPLDEVL